ncbi:MAG: M23 family metallopeptidase [Candidatus Binatia bacterium]
MRARRSLLVVLAAAGLLFAARSEQVAAATVSVNSREVLQGEIVELKLSGAAVADVKGRMGKESIYFYPAGKNGYAAIVGVDLEAKPGSVKIIIEGKTESGELLERQFDLDIKANAFQREEFSVPAAFDQLSADVIKRIRRERERLDRVFMGSAPARLWQGPFLQPVTGSITAPFGYRRVINGLPRAPHTGADLRAALGTEVAAPNHGRVVLLGEFFYSGKSLVLDHGAGLFTMYFHLSEFKVQEGSVVRKGEIIALSGMSGRVTGPHLHWGARINNARVDPFQLVEKLGSGSDTRHHSEETEK